MNFFFFGINRMSQLSRLETFFFIGVTALVITWESDCSLFKQSMYQQELSLQVNHNDVIKLHFYYLIGNYIDIVLQCRIFPCHMTSLEDIK